MPTKLSNQWSNLPPLRFSDAESRASQVPGDETPWDDDVLEALDSMSRRIDDLARELNCLGYFDDDDGPRAA